MTELLYSADKVVLYFINNTLSSPFLDAFFKIITSVNNWIPVYVILLLLCFFKGGKKGKWAVLFVLLMILVTDQFSAKILKEAVQRVRPCNALTDIITPLGCQGTWSFPSNHAVNNFAVAVFFTLLFPKYRVYYFVAAIFVSVSRVYLGLHYPSDILAGAVIGSFFGYLFGHLTLIISKKNFKLWKRKSI